MVSGSAYRARLVDPVLDEYLAQLPAVLVLGPRAIGKSTTLARRAATVVSLDREAETAAFEADPDAALRDLEEPVLLDEWQNVPGVLGAVRRAVQDNPSPGRFFVTGSVRAELENEVWPATGRLTRVDMHPMTVSEQQERIGGQTFFEKLSSGSELVTPREPLDLVDYVELALQSGFPTAALQLHGRPRRAWLESYVSDLLTHDVRRLEESATKHRDAQRLRSYFEAYALNSAGIADHTTIYTAAGVNKVTAMAYEGLLADLLVTERVKGWASNRLKRLVHAPKRYVVDPALMASVLGLDAQAVIRDGNMLGRLIDTFVTAQLRPEAAVMDPKPGRYHLRTGQGRREVDQVFDLGAGRLIGIEVKAGTAPKADDAKHLAWLRDEIRDRFVAGVVFHTGPRAYELGEKIIAAPISTLWAQKSRA